MKTLRRANLAAVCLIVGAVIVLLWGFSQRSAAYARVCGAQNESRMALRRVMDESVQIRRERGDPAAEEFARRFEVLKREFLQPIEC